MAMFMIALCNAKKQNYKNRGDCMGKDYVRKELEDKLDELSAIEKNALKELTKLPEGKIYAKRRGENCCQFFWKKDSETDWQYLKKSEDKFATELIQREYTEKVLKTICEQRKLIEKFVKKYNEKSVLDVVNKISEPKLEKIKMYVKDDMAYICDWYKKQEEIIAKASKYVYSIKAGEDIEILTEKGESVKSKSEKIIADKLNMMNIPYCYEVPLYLKGYGYVKPDFKVLNVATRKEYYWEHYGMMDNKDYIIKALKKKNSYISNNFIVGYNLIETYESQSCPLDTRNVEKIIKTFLV